ncbi:3-deoxy-D-manno-octulosonate 8-phosphate phosphatase, partial [Butyricicoccus sp. 1XD8-22]
DALDVIKETVNYVCTNDGGKGAVREMIDIILKNQTNYEDLIDNFISK